MGSKKLIAKLTTKLGRAPTADEVAKAKAKKEKKKAKVPRPTTRRRPARRQNQWKEGERGQTPLPGERRTTSKSSPMTNLRAAWHLAARREQHLRAARGPVRGKGLGESHARAGSSLARP